MEIPKVRSEQSVRDLLADLGAVYTEDKSVARNTIYQNLLRKGVLENADKVHWREDYANHCYTLRHRGFLEDDAQLESALTTLEETYEGDVDPLMKFLTLLSGSVPHRKTTGFIPSLTAVTVDRSPRYHGDVDRSPRYHGDAALVAGHTERYLEYRDELFSRVHSCPEIETTEKDLEGFPASNGLISKFIRPNQAAISAGPSDNRILADLPPLPPPSITGIFKSLGSKPEVPALTAGPHLKTRVVQRFAPVERGASERAVCVRRERTLSDSSGLGSAEEEEGGGGVEEAWEVALRDLEVELPDPTYETLGQRVLVERPYLSEAGGEVYTRLCVLLTSPYTERIDMVTEAHVLYQCQFVLLGIPTTIFHYDAANVEFVPVQNICFVGVSPDSLVDSLYTIAYTGTLYLRLKMFCEQYSCLERYGSVARGLVTAIEQFLTIYQNALNNMSVGGLLELLWKTRGMSGHLEFLCNLVLLEEGIPLGPALLQYLYETASVMAFSPDYSLILALFRSAMAPYLRFLEQWLVEGRVWDGWEEFHVIAHPEWLHNKDFLFWEYAFTERDSSPVPEFLGEVREQLLSTGKLINLFRQCQTAQHPLTTSSTRSPGLRVCYGDAEISAQINRWETYKAAIEWELREEAVVRNIKKQEEEDRKKQKILASKQDTKRRMDALLAEVGAGRQARAEVQRRQLERLQEQVLAKSTERAALLAAERAEDKERIERATTHQYKLVAEVRAQLEDYYSSLTAERARAERRSMWRLQRMRLGKLRRAFLLWEGNRQNRQLRVYAETGVRPETEEAKSTTETGVRPEIEEAKSTAETDIQPQTAGVRVGESPTIETGVQPETEEVVSEGEIDVEIAGSAGSSSPIEGEVKRSTSSDAKEPSLSSPVPGEAGETEICLTTSGEANTAATTEIATVEVDVKKEGGETIPEKASVRERGGSSEDNDSEISFTLPSDTPAERQYEPEGKMKNILYGDGDGGDGGGDSERQFEPEGKMKDILYGDSDNPDSTKPTAELAQPEEESPELITPTNPPESTERKFEPDGQMQEILYGEGGVASSSGVGEYEPEGQMKDILYGEGGVGSSSGGDGDRSGVGTGAGYEPAGQMKDILYGGGGTDTDYRPGTKQFTDKSDSRMRDLLYGGKRKEEREERVIVPQTIPQLPDDSGFESDFQIAPVRLEYPELSCGSGGRPNPGIMTDRVRGLQQPDTTAADGAVERHRTLGVTLHRMLVRPLLLQCSLVNTAAVRYFLDELEIGAHFADLRSYHCMSDGMFGDSLSKCLFNAMDSAVDLSPAMLGSILHEAMESSRHSSRLELTSGADDVNILAGLSLRYDIGWPCNIVITDGALAKYNKIFRFLLRLKYGCFVADKIWFLLGSVDKKCARNSPQLRRLQVCRYEVSQFLHAVQIYVTHQVHNISWHELQADLSSVGSVGELHTVHERYLNNAIERLLLGEGTKAPYEVLLKVLRHLSSFAELLESRPFDTDPTSNVTTHPCFDRLVNIHESFMKQAIFILKVAEASNSSGYKPYIDEFITRLDFNSYYRAQGAQNKRHSLGPRSTAATPI